MQLALRFSTRLCKSYIVDNRSFVPNYGTQSRFGDIVELFYFVLHVILIMCALVLSIITIFAIHFTLYRKSDGGYKCKTATLVSLYIAPSIVALTIRVVSSSAALGGVYFDRSFYSFVSYFMMIDAVTNPIQGFLVYLVFKFTHGEGRSIYI